MSANALSRHWALTWPCYPAVNARTRSDIVLHRRTQARSSAWPLLPRLHRGLGALLVLRDDGTPGPLHGEPGAAAGPRRAHRRVRRVSRCAGIDVGSADTVRARLHGVRALHRLRLFHTGPGRLHRRSLDRAAQRRRARRRLDERRPPRDGLRPIVPAGAAAARRGLRFSQGQHLGAGGRAVSLERRSPAHARVRDLQHGDQFRRRRRTPGLRLSRAALRLARRLRGGRGVHAHRACDLSLWLSPSARARAAPGARYPPAYVSGVANHLRARGGDG